MAITWGGVLGSNHQKVGIEVTMSPAVVDINTAEVTLTIKYFTYQTHASGDNQTLHKTGDWNGTNAFNMPATANYQLQITTNALVVATVRGAAVTKTFNAHIDGHWEGVIPTVSGVAFTVPARPYAVPTAPTIGTTVRNSDTSATANWTNAATAEAPYTSLAVYRQTDGGGSVQVALLAGGATSYTDTTTTANHSYTYGVKALNSSGYADSAVSNAVSMTPAAPSNCVATKTGATQVTVTCTDNANTETAFAWERTADGGANWTALGTTGAGVTTYVDNAAPGGTIAYRVRATRSALVSAYSATSNSVTTTTPPAAPTLTAWPVYSPTGTVIRVAWLHNTLDGSAQSKADIVYTKDGASTTYTLNASTAYYDIPITGLVATKVVTVKVRTYGLHATAGAYSGTQSTTLANSPQATITTPATDATVVADVPLTAAWDFTDDFAQAGWEMRLFRAGVLACTWTGTTETSQEIGSAYLTNLEEFSLELTVRSGSGVSVTTTRLFTTDYVAPTVPSVYATWDPVALAATVVGLAGETGALPAVDHLALQRIDTFDGVATTTVLADPLTDGSTITDYTPRLGQDVIYRVLAIASNGAFSITDAALLTKASGYYALNFGAGDATLFKMRFNRDIDHATSDDSEVLTFADRALPVVYAGEHVSESISLSAIVNDDASRTAMRALRVWKRAVILREKDGYRARVKVGSIADKPGPVRGSTVISLDMTVVE